MRTNLFKFRKINKDKIILEEEKLDSPFLLFFKKYGKYLILLIMLLAIISLIIGLYFVIKNLDDSTKIATNISSVVVEFDKTDEFNSINMKPITGGMADKVFYSRYGNIGLIEGVIIVVKEEPSPNGLVTFYSDGSAKLDRTDGKIIRVSSLDNNSYGITEKGEIIIGAKTKEISIKNTKELEDGSKIIYYSDNSASIEYQDRKNKKEQMLVRNSDRIVIENNNLKEITPSGVTKIDKEDKISNIKITYYEDGTIKLEEENNTYIVRNNEDFNIDNKSLTFPNNNEATILRELNLKNGSKLIYYTDGSAEIKKDNDSIMVRQSKDIIYNENGIIEIIETKYTNEIVTKTPQNNREVRYLDNGGALIKNPNGTYEYAHENSDIKYDNNGNIKDESNTIKEKNHKTTPDGTIVINLDDGKTVIITDDGYRVVDTDDIVYDLDGNIVRIIGDEDVETSIDGSVSDNRFVINNVSGNTIKFMITIEITDNYMQYAPKWLNPKFLRFNIVENSNYLENQVFDKKLQIGTVLEGNTIIQKETYILYESVLENQEKADINLGIWLDYEDITNDYQDSVFAGTIKVYTETIK